MDYLKLFVESPVFPVLVVIAGWFTMNWLSARAQKRHFQNELMNSARLEIAAGVIAYVDWLSEVYAALRMPLVDWPSPDQARDEDRRLSSLTLDPRARVWHGPLEHYELLFPETARVRNNLVMMSSAVSKFLRTLSLAYLKSEDREGLAAAKDQALRDSSYVLDQAALIHDLLRHLQNKSLSEITGRSIPPRIPTSSGPRLILRDGMLEIVERKTPAKLEDPI